MISSLTGTISDIGLNSVVVECNGVGYAITATPNTLSLLEKGKTQRVLTTMVVREDSMTLFGFLDHESREMFSLLQTVSGLGPRLALACESVYTPAEISNAVNNSDTKALQRIPGVGKRMAERLVVELKGKVGVFEQEAEVGAVNQPSVEGSVGLVSQEIIDALTGLGFAEKQAIAAVNTVLAETGGNDDATIDKSAVLRKALSNLSGKQR